MMRKGNGKMYISWKSLAMTAMGIITTFIMISYLNVRAEMDKKVDKDAFDMLCIQVSEMRKEFRESASEIRNELREHRKFTGEIK